MIALIIIYNHRYDKNIETVERIYKGRFSHIFHLMPFYDGDKPNVFPVYDNSYCFQAFVAQTFPSIFNKKFSHYFFVSDDMIINPEINETNLASLFNLDNETCFIQEPIGLPNKNWRYNRNALNFKPYCKTAFFTKGVEIAGQLPDKEIADEILAKWGYKKDLKFTLADRYRFLFSKNWRVIIKDILEDIFVHRSLPRKLQYPLIASTYSDLFIVSGDALKKFSHYCGVFAAARLFVEIALPTALALSAKKLNTSSDIPFHCSELGGGGYSDDIKQVINSCNFDIAELLKKFPENELYIHPVKLSKWNMVFHEDGQTHYIFFH